MILRMAPRGALGAILWSAAAGLNAAAPPPAFYTAVEVDRFVPVRGVEFPFDYRTALMEDIARETSHALITVIILHEGETPPDGRAVLRVSGLIESRREGKHNFYSVRTDHFGDLLLSLFSAAGEVPRNKKYKFHDFTLAYTGA